LERGFEEFEKEGVDSVLSVVKQKRFNWMKDENGFFYPTNYDIYNRPRRQNFEGYYVENGAFYISSKDNLIQNKNRISGNIRAVEMCEDSYFEIDELSDWRVVEMLMENNGPTNHRSVPEIKLFLTDCDGCLTDGGMYYSEMGDELKKFNTRDGMGIAILKENNIITGIITGEKVELNRRRAEKLKVDIIKMGCKDKLSVVKDICEEYGIEMKNVCYVGDDINDIEVIKEVGYGCAPADACSEVKDVADFITTSSGGNGVIREIADLIVSNFLE